MFREINDVKQEPAGGRRRWFESDGLDLVVWYQAESDNRMTGFQLCYDVQARRYALTWRADAGFSHSAVDTGDETPFRNETPVLTLESQVPWDTIATRFAANSGSLEPWLAKLIRDKLATRGS